MRGTTSTMERRRSAGPNATADSLAATTSAPTSLPASFTGRVT